MADFLKPVRLADLGDPEEIDLQQSIARLTDQVTAAVDRRFPGSAIVVAYLEERDGLVYLTANGAIGGPAPQDDAERHEREEEVNRIARPIFDSYEWVVRRDS